MRLQRPSALVLLLAVSVLLAGPCLAGRRRSSKGTSAKLVSAAGTEEESGHEDHAANRTSAAAGGRKREGKFFSLFNVVTFRNEPCRSLSTLTTSMNRNGTCLTSTECQNRGGQISGNCAAGFGSCCLFVLQGAGTVTQNCTYIRNVGFPGNLIDATPVAVTVQRCDPNVCSLRLDFESFSLLGTSDSVETMGGMCQDTFTVMTMAGPTFPVICGLNTGQHIYVDLGSTAGSTATLNFAFMAAAAGMAVGTRQWEIKVSQIDCIGNDSSPPQGCFQFHTETSGRIQTFNFQPASTTETHLQNHRYSVCIRQAEGFGCVQYMVCSDIMMNGFSLLTIDGAGTAVTAGLIDTNCSEDYIVISGSSNVCSKTAGGVPMATRSRYCGVNLNVVEAVMGVDVAVCDCTAPFVVGVVLDGTADGNAATNAALSSGVCLEYMQVAC